VLNFGNFLAKTRAFLVKTRAFWASFEAFLNAKIIFSLPHIIYIAHFRQFGRYVTFISEFPFKVFGDFGCIISFH